jgi:hypothetical protein
MSKKRVKVEDISEPVDGYLSKVESEDLKPLPAPLNEPPPDMKPLTDDAREKYESDLDGTMVLSIPKPKDAAEEKALVEKFLSGLEKLFSEGGQLDLPAAAGPCPWSTARTATRAPKPVTSTRRAATTSSTGPIYRSEILRRIYFKYIKKAAASTDFRARQHRPQLGDRGPPHRALLPLQPVPALRPDLPDRRRQRLLSREMRKIASQEMGISPKELHQEGAPCCSSRPDRPPA